MHDDEGSSWDRNADSAASTSASKADALAALSEKERLRRMKIAQANAGKMPWNKGRKHSPGE